MSLIRGAFFHCFYFIAFTSVSSLKKNTVYRNASLRVEDIHILDGVNGTSTETDEETYLNRTSEYGIYPLNKDDLNSYSKGATFSPRHLLKLAMRLGELVKDEKGGFVSSARSPEELADKLFYAFFRTDTRFIKLEDKDLATIRLLLRLNELNKDDIESVDEEVLKLYLELRKTEDGQVMNIESLNEYFNRIITFQSGASRDDKNGGAQPGGNGPKPGDDNQDPKDDYEDPPPNIIDLIPYKPKTAN